MNRLTLLLLFTCVVLTNFVVSQCKMDSVFNAFQKDKALANASISFLAVDVASDSLLFTYRDSVALPPASTVKLFSTATALEILGNTYKPSTKIYADSIDLQDSILTGNIYIKGAADISLGSQYFNKEDSLHLFLNSWAEALRKKGIKKIKGNVIGDGSAFGYNGAPNGWSMEDLGNYYGAFHSGLSIYDNLVRFYFNVPAPKLKPVLIKSFPEIPNLTLKNQLIALNGVGDNSLIYGAPYGYDRVIRGSLSANSPNFIVKGSMPDPEIQFLQAFKSVMENNGILIEGDLIGGRSLSELKLPIDYSKFILLHEHIGKSVEEIVYWTNMKSINVFAETLTAWLGYESTKDGSTESGVQIMENFWKTKINTAGLNLTDGSGLSRSNSVSARNYCSLLKYMYTSKNSLMFMKSLPIAGQTGTLSNFCKGQLSEGKFIAKSGSMRRIKSYAGYMDTQSGKKIIFAIIVNNYNCSNSAIMKKLEPVMNALYLQ